jgi:hypothetical protein
MTFRSFSDSTFDAEQEYGSLNDPSWHETWRIQLYRE